jgi:hypothetical protein
MVNIYLYFQNSFFYFLFIILGADTSLISNKTILIGELVGIDDDDNDDENENYLYLLILLLIIPIIFIGYIVKKCNERKKEEVHHHHHHIPLSSTLSDTFYTALNSTSA